jgi:ankyrin repeat protein
MDLLDIIYACTRCGCVDAVKEIIAKNPITNLDVSHDYCLVKISAENGHIVLFDYFFNMFKQSITANRVHISTSESDHDKILSLRKECLGLAAENGFLDLVIHIDKLGHNKEESTALLKAIRGQHLCIVEYLVNAGYLEACNMKTFGRFEHEILLEVANTGNIEILKFLVKSGCNPSLVPKSEILIQAIGFNNIEMVKYLIDEIGCDARVCNDEAFIVAASFGHLEICKYLQEKKCNPTSKNYKALSECIWYGSTKSVKYLLKWGFDAIRLRRDRSLQLCGANGWLDIIEALVNAGYNNSDDLADTLSSAAKNGHLPIVKYVSNLHYSPNKFCKTALENAVCFGHAEIVRYLVEAFYKGERLDHNIVSRAAISNSVEIIEYFTNLGYDLGAIYGVDMLNYHINHGRLEVFRYLIGTHYNLENYVEYFKLSMSQYLYTYTYNLLSTDITRLPIFLYSFSLLPVRSKLSETQKLLALKNSQNYNNKFTVATSETHTSNLMIAQVKKQAMPNSMLKKQNKQFLKSILKPSSMHLQLSSIE